MVAEPSSILSRRIVSDVGDKCRAEAQSWFHDYLQMPHDLLGRRGAVCPFASTAEETRTIEVEVVDATPGLSIDEGNRLVEEMVEAFRGIPWAHTNQLFHCLVVVLNGWAFNELPVLDRVQRDSKPGLAARGLMLGQFHPRCREPAARNPAFQVAVSPIPMLALRNIALHDILFLDGDEVCFRAYEERFGDRYVRSAVADPLFVRLYWAARRRFDESKSRVWSS